jgi:hypothetical protein
MPDNDEFIDIAVEPPFSVQFQWSEVSNLTVKLLTFKIFLSLVLKCIASQRNNKWDFAVYTV